MERDMREAAAGCIPLGGRGGRRILFELHGIEHPIHPTGPGRAFSRYDEVTHVTTSPRGLWLGTRRAALLVPRSAFGELDGPERVAQELLRRIAALPDAQSQLARMAHVDAVSQEVRRTPAVWGLAGVCGLVFLAQLLLGSDVQEVGYYSGPLFDAGDRWRIVTANFVHALPSFPLHLLLNMAGAVLIGGLCERALGSVRTLVVMGASGLLAMQACGWFDYPPVVGASGIVAGLLGSLTWLEFRRPDELPAWWRLPRRPLVVVLLVSVVVDWLVPAFAGAAHLGGFFGGALATALVAGRPIRAARPAGWVRALAGALCVLGLAGVGKAVVELTTTADYAARNLTLISQLPGVSAEELNERAWLVAINEDSTDELLQAALLAAQRAVDLSERRESAILDTLAEVHFVLGQGEEALAAIDEAIALTPFEPYYQEQRRRYTGERDADDRPDPPMPWLVIPGPWPDAPAVPSTPTPATGA